MNTSMNIFCKSLAVAMLLAVLAPAALAQREIAGNAHPAAQALTQTATPNPFGNPPTSSTSSLEDKHAFAQQLDLAPLRDLAVSNRGRVKILDTLARETIQTITGKRRYMDFRVTGSGDDIKVKKLKYDPLFTYLDLLIDPAYYLDKPLVHVEYLPLRQAFLDNAFDDTQQRERWLKLTRLSPIILATQFRSLAQSLGADPEHNRGLARIQSSLDFLNFGYAELLLVPPSSSAQDWQHVTLLPADSPVPAAMADLAIAWRAQDATRVNEQVRKIAKELPTINPDKYPGSRRTVEAFYNASHPFEWGAWAYCVSLVLLLLAFGTGRRALVVTGVAALAIALLLHTYGFGARWIIAERYPIQNQFESMTGLALGGALFGASIMLLKRQWLFGAASAGVGFLVLLTATQTAIPGADIGREAAILNTSVLLKYHVSSVLVGYGLITLGFFISTLYLWTYYSSRRKGANDAAAVMATGLGLDESVNTGPQRVLRDLDRAQMTVLQLAFWVLGVGILLGAWWADHSWGRWWAFDPKETWALITWIVYLIVIHMRIATTKNRALVTAWLSVAGFFVMLWTYFGVNLILPGLHAYA